MNWKLEISAGKPGYHQIVHYFERKIVSGELPPGNRLPPERELALQLAVNRSTVSAAYEELRARGLITSVQGSGTRVSELLWDTSERQAPNWRRYGGGSLFHPAEPYYKRIGQALSLPGIVNMSLGELSPDLMPLARLAQLSGEIDYDRPFSYWTNSRGDAWLRETLSAYLGRQLSIGAAPGQLIVTAGVKHALYLIVSALLQPGDTVAVEGPSYLYAMQVFTPAGIRMVKLDVDEHGLIPELVPELFRRHRIKMVFVNPTYQNPTGTTLPLARRRRLLELCTELGLPIVEDDPYGRLSLSAGASLPAPIRALPGAEQSVIYLGTLSKTVSPGMRIGWIAAPYPIAERLAEAKSRMGYTTSHPGERLAQRWLASDEAESHLAFVTDALARRRAVMLEAIRKHAAACTARFAPNAPQGGFYIWLKLRSPVPDKELFEACIRSGVIVMPGLIYGAEKGYLRLSYASVNDNLIEEGIARLGSALRSL
ncbi:PLP-dependent aminotransferase family protein [Paenibacillus chartarius]|uniref:PLP-dependent aminotransferase family protein n=1 Tax=Paenibacillus chartarius TaxID=747481 RepID=A0ABV6DS79_9BACL